ncbi:hybrid sensor histidine kinase/response regulator [Sphingobacterium wenxiniae]|uniref:histidine kinase n=1 Tax=Sphingobacterium wenxiniae TaxID=683125 RepID=A0A1I6Q814_9SPHI|nr:hybrid sensor histidine kinase/response regulator [Sphingobacterium wenxiniae]SFS48623.1 Signal transduction histidine kinase [Sphingobacterium wenxiniae]
MQKEIKILYIDDEVNNLVSFKANFRLHYQIFTASDTTEGLQILRHHPDIRVIFCDQRMPGELGVDFFNRIKHDFSQPIRILLTAYADMEMVIDAINKGHIFRFVRKPWVEEEIISAIEEANKFYIASSLLAVRNEELQRAYDELDKFAYSVSHDLRDPLTGILSAIQLSSKFDEIEKVRELLFLMDGSVRMLDAYIDSLRDYYLLRRGELTLSTIDFNELMDNIRQFYTVYIQNNDVAFNIDVNQQEVFQGDKAVIELILHNLLSNAFKYQRKHADNKMVNLSVDVKEGYLHIEISDTGIGISPEYIDDIFKLFFRGSDQATGMGFGLYNVQSALLKVQGTIEVDSLPDVGTHFKIKIPSK